MQYMLLIYENEEISKGWSEDQFKAHIGKYFEFTTEVREAGAFQAGAPLQSVTTATTVRVREGEALTTDGPFAETKETLGGYYLVDCENLDEALKWAAKIPGAAHGSIEVRPVQVFD